MIIEDVSSIEVTAALQSRLVRRELTPVFRTVWMRSPGTSLCRIPDGCGELIWCNGKLFAYGPAVACTTMPFPSTATLVGLRFLPGAAAKWLEVSSTDILGVCAPLEEVSERRARGLADAVGNAADPLIVSTRLEAALIETISARTSLNLGCLDKVLELLAREHGNGGFLRALKQAYNCSERSARRETVKVFGYGPKTAERIWRVQRFLHSARSPQSTNLAWLANFIGFSDQAHMTREVHSIAGMTPGEAVIIAQRGDVP